MPIPVVVWAILEVAAVIAAKQLAKKLILDRAKKEAARRLKDELQKKLEKELKDKAQEAARKAAASGAKTTKPKAGTPSRGNTAPKRHKGKKNKKYGRCELRPFSPDTCKPLTGHHVVPDRVFRIGARKTGARIHPGPSENDGLVVCVDGKNASRTKEHGQIHERYDHAEAALGAMGNPVGTTELIKLEALGAASVGKVTGCNVAKMMADLRTEHQAMGLDPNMKVRADPWGKISKSLDPKKLGSGTVRKGGATR